jgi:hypothetical protein
MHKILSILMLWFCSQTVAIAKGDGEEPIKTNSPTKPKTYSKNRAFMPALTYHISVGGLPTKTDTKEVSLR